LYFEIHIPFHQIKQIVSENFQIMPVVPGLLFAVTRPFDPSLTEEEWDDWYSNKHIVDVVNCGLASVGVRYRNISPSSDWPHLAIYRLPDLPKLYDPVFMATVPTDSPKSWGSGYMPDVAKAELRGYRTLKVFEVPDARDGIAKFLVSIEAKAEGSSEDGFVESYKTKHLAGFSKMKGYRRTMLYRSAEAFVPQENKADTDEREGTDFHAASEQRPDYLVIHEFENEPAVEQLTANLENLIKLGVWEYVAEYGTGLYSVEPTKRRR
jgi:hypothetical protein